MPDVSALSTKLDAIDLALPVFGDRKKVPPKKRKEYDAEVLAAQGAYSERLQSAQAFVDKLAKTDEGSLVLAKVALDDTRAISLRHRAAIAALPRAHAEMAAKTDPKTWSVTPETAKLHSCFARAIFCGDPKKAFDRLSPFVKAGDERAEAILIGGHRASPDYLTMLAAHELAEGEPPIDPRWIPVLLDVVRGEEHAAFALFVLKAVPIDATVIDPILDAWGPKPEAVAHYGKAELEVLQRVADERCVPYLLEALRKSWMAWPPVFRGFATAGDPVMAHAIREWLEENGDGPKGERTRGGKEAIAKLEAKGKVPAPEEPFFAKKKKKPKKKKKKKGK